MTVKEKVYAALNNFITKNAGWVYMLDFSMEVLLCRDGIGSNPP